jgi:hypothetical protein
MCAKQRSVIDLRFRSFELLRLLFDVDWVVYRPSHEKGKVFIFMYREDGWLARIAAFSPAVITATCAICILIEPFNNSTGPQKLAGGLKELFFTLVNRGNVTVLLLMTMTYVILFLFMERELRDAPKFKYAVIGNSIVILCSVAALWLGGSSVWFWSAIVFAGVATSFFFRKKFGDHLLF